MNSIIPAPIAPAAHWLEAQVTAMRGVISALITGGSFPARQTLIYTFVMIALLFLLTKGLSRKKGKS